MEYFQEATPAADGSAFDLDIPPSDDEQQEHEEQQKEPLTEAQERRLRDYLDEEFTQIQRHLTKRSLHPELSSQESNPLQSCTAFLRTIQRLLRIILFANSSSTQTEHLLRLTGQLLSGLSDYPSPPLTPLLDLLNDFDRGWVALLKGQQWTPTGDAVYAPSLSSVSMTHKIRLRGLVSEFQRVVFELSRPGQQPSEDEEEEDGGRLNEESDSDESDFEQVTPVQRPLAQEEEEVHRAVVMPRTMARLQEDIDGVGQG